MGAGTSLATRLESRGQSNPTPTQTHEEDISGQLDSQSAAVDRALEDLADMASQDSVMRRVFSAPTSARSADCRTPDLAMQSYRRSMTGRFPGVTALPGKFTVTSPCGVSITQDGGTSIRLQWLKTSMEPPAGTVPTVLENSETMLLPSRCPSSSKKGLFHSDALGFSTSGATQ